MLNMNFVFYQLVRQRQHMQILCPLKRITIKIKINKNTSFMEALEFIHAIKYISPNASALDLFTFGNNRLTF